MFIARFKLRAKTEGRREVTLTNVRRVGGKNAVNEP